MNDKNDRDQSMREAADARPLAREHLVRVVQGLEVIIASLDETTTDDTNTTAH